MLILYFPFNWQWVVELIGYDQEKSWYSLGGIPPTILILWSKRMTATSGTNPGWFYCSFREGGNQLSWFYMVPHDDIASFA